MSSPGWSCSSSSRYLSTRPSNPRSGGSPIPSLSREVSSPSRPSPGILGLLRLPVALAALPFLGLLGWAVLKNRYSWEDLKPHLRWDLVFLIGFAAMLLVRLANPTIITAEKFIDHAFIASIMRSPVVPPTDPWYAGGTMNIYYYGGYWLMGILGTLTAFRHRLSSTWPSPPSSHSPR